MSHQLDEMPNECGPQLLRPPKVVTIHDRRLEHRTDSQTNKQTKRPTTRQILRIDDDFPWWCNWWNHNELLAYIRTTSTRKLANSTIVALVNRARFDLSLAEFTYLVCALCVSLVSVYWSYWRVVASRFDRAPIESAHKPKGQLVGQLVCL